MSGREPLAAFFGMDGRSCSRGEAPAAKAVLLLSAPINVFALFAVWIHQKLHGVCGASRSRQIFACEQRRDSCDDQTHVREGQRQCSNSLAFDLSRRRLNHRPAVSKIAACEIYSFSSPVLSVACHVTSSWVGRALVACASQGPKAFANATEKVFCQLFVFVSRTSKH
jgi:hypothetical protein